MMYASKEVAEQAAIDGKGVEYDTQLCIGLQAEILSVSTFVLVLSTFRDSNMDGTDQRDRAALFRKRRR